MSQRAVVRSWGYLAFIWAVALLFSFVSLGAVLDELGGEWSVGMVAWVAVPPLMAVRALRLSVRVTDQDVTVRNFFRTQRIPRGDIVSIDPVAYGGLWTEASESRVFSTVRICTRERTVAATCLLGRAVTAKAAAVRLRQLVDLPLGTAGGEEGGKHRQR